jgi:hypothetical protein
MLAWLTIVVLLVGFTLVLRAISQARDHIERLYTHLRDFDSGVARSFDTVDAAISVVNEELVAPRCGSGSCNRRAAWEIRSSDGMRFYTCSNHDIWSDSPDVVRRPLH